MKKFLLIVVCIFSTLTVAAQTKVTWSLELGLGMSTWMGKDADGSNPLFNPKVGVGIDVPLTGLVSFQTGLSWVSKGASYDAGTGGEKVKLDQNYFEMPLLAAFHVGTACKFDMVFTAGPYLAYGVNGKASLETAGITTSWDTFDDVESIVTVKVVSEYHDAAIGGTAILIVAGGAFLARRKISEKYTFNK